MEGNALNFGQKKYMCMQVLENIQTNTDKRVEIFNVWQRQSKSKWPQINLPQHMPHNKHAAAQSLLQQFATLSDTATKDSEHFQHNTQQPTFQFIVTGNLKKKKKTKQLEGVQNRVQALYVVLLMN